jgi:hypothetical protein
LANGLHEPRTCSVCGSTFGVPVGTRSTVTGCGSCGYAAACDAATVRFSPITDRLDVERVPYNVEQTGGMVFVLYIPIGETCERFGLYDDDFSQPDSSEFGIDRYGYVLETVGPDGEYLDDGPECEWFGGPVWSGSAPTYVDVERFAEFVLDGYRAAVLDVERTESFGLPVNGSAIRSIGSHGSEVPV